MNALIRDRDTVLGTHRRSPTGWCASGPPCGGNDLDPDLDLDFEVDAPPIVAAEQVHVAQLRGEVQHRALLRRLRPSTRAMIGRRSPPTSALP